jgi:nanoRNase/pAp phosphatase (c-di-AMP/oligoRNAs hydrolase)
MQRLASIAELRKFIESREGSKAAITFHSLGDTDSISSAIALSQNFYGDIVCSDRITHNSERLLTNMGIKDLLKEPPMDPSVKLIVLVDVNNFDGCGPLSDFLKSFTGEVLIIDHHAATEIANSKVYVFDDETYTSTASIILELLETAGKTPTQMQKKLLLMGIISDSAELRNSNSRTFLQIGKLLESTGQSYPGIIEEMTFRASPKEREKVVHDICGSHKEAIGSLLVLWGEAKAKANVVADTAIRLGADVSIFYSENEYEISISARLRPPLDTELGIHLGKIFKELEKLISGTGGGHPCAAGAYGPQKEGKERFIDGFLDAIDAAANSSPQTRKAPQPKA